MKCNPLREKSDTLQATCNTRQKKCDTLHALRFQRSVMRFERSVYYQYTEVCTLLHWKCTALRDDIKSFGKISIFS